MFNQKWKTLRKDLLHSLEPKAKTIPNYRKALHNVIKKAKICLGKIPKQIDMSRAPTRTEAHSPNTFNHLKTLPNLPCQMAHSMMTALTMAEKSARSRQKLGMMEQESAWCRLTTIKVLTSKPPFAKFRRV